MRAFSASELGGDVGAGGCTGFGFVVTGGGVVIVGGGAWPLGSVGAGGVGELPLRGGPECWCRRCSSIVSPRMACMRLRATSSSALSGECAAASWPIASLRGDGRTGLLI